MFPGFGIRHHGAVTLLERILENAKSLDSIAAQLVIRDAYETQFGIFNHADPAASPLALVEYRPKEDVSEYGGLYRTFYQYHLYEVNKEWGLSVDEFLSLPREYYSLILRISSEKAARQTVETQKQILLAQKQAQSKPSGLGGRSK